MNILSVYVWFFPDNISQVEGILDKQTMQCLLNDSSEYLAHAVCGSEYLAHAVCVCVFVMHEYVILPVSTLALGLVQGRSSSRVVLSSHR